MVTLSQVLLVTGGYIGGSGSEYISSTEVISYPDGQAWREVGPLPSPRYDLRGASLAGVLHVTGGIDQGNNFYNFTFTTNQGENIFSAVLAWDPVAETWSEVGKLDPGRFLHAVTALPMAAVEDYCD